jgi:hypothetical protein
MPDSSLQLDLFVWPTSWPERTCVCCCRPDSEAPAFVINDRGRFCIDCRVEAFRWPLEQETGVGTSPRPASSSPGGRPYAAGGPDHGQGWRNPAAPANGGGKGDAP